MTRYRVIGRAQAWDEAIQLHPGTLCPLRPITNEQLAAALDRGACVVHKVIDDPMERS